MDNLTRVPAKIEARSGHNVLLHGTGFFYRVDESEAFVTNWHVVSGRSPTTWQPLHPSGALPDHLRIEIPWLVKDGEQSAIQWRAIDYPLYDDPDFTKAVWWVHPVRRHVIDVAALDLNGVGETGLFAANDSRLDLNELSTAPGHDAFTIGYPLGMYGGAKFPIWKRGTIASEPDIDLDGLPKAFIDTATREGMSGSPVYVQQSGLWYPAGETELGSVVIGTGRMFLGVYSGRVGADDEFKAQLGVVWKRSAIDEVIRARLVGESAFSLRPSAPPE